MIPAGYRPLDELVRAWDALAARGARVSAVGVSVEGRPTRCVEIGPEGASCATVAMAGIHALEWIGPHLLLALARRLVEDPPCDRRVVLFPLVNIDGYAAVERDLHAGRARWRRGNARGVDLNRNFPTAFRARTVGSTLLPFVYRPGAAPRSEPEVDALVATLDGIHARGVAIDRALSLHSIGRKILYPWGGQWKPPAARAELERAAHALRARFDERYDVVQCARWVPGAFAYGMEIDHLHAAYGALALLVEISGGGFRWSEPATYLAPFRWFNPPEPERVAQGLVGGLEAFVRARDA